MKTKKNARQDSRMALMEKTEGREMLTPCFYKKLGTWGLKVKNKSKTQLMSVTHLQFHVWKDLFLLQMNIQLLLC